MKTLKVGDSVVIQDRPRLWTGYHVDKDGRGEVSYPYHLIVKEVQHDSNGRGIRFTEGIYGWYYEESYPIFKMGTSYESKATVVGATKEKVAPITIGHTSSAPTLVYGKTPTVAQISTTVNKPIVEGMGAGEVLRLWRETGQIVMPQKSTRFAHYKNDNDIERYFEGVAEGLPSDFLPHKKAIEDSMFEGNLRFTTLSGESQYDICFYKANRIEEEFYNYLKDYDYEHIGYYSERVLTKVLGISEEAIVKLQKESAELLGEMVCSIDGGLAYLSNIIIHLEKNRLTGFVGDTWDWEENKAYAFKYNGVNYFGHFTY